MYCLSQLETNNDKQYNNKEVRSKIMSIDPQKRKELKINKSTLWYQQKKIKEGKSIKMYRKTVNKYGEE